MQQVVPRWSARAANRGKVSTARQRLAPTIHATAGAADRDALASTKHIVGVSAGREGAGQPIDVDFKDYEAG